MQGEERNILAIPAWKEGKSNGEKGLQQCKRD
jgi:hypothetical protein